jgi:hypothetical protein
VTALAGLTINNYFYEWPMWIKVLPVEIYILYAYHSLKLYYHNTINCKTYTMDMDQANKNKLIGLTTQY